MLNSIARCVSLFVVVGLLLACFTVPALGVAITWDNGGGDQLWSNNANWNADNPAAGNDITFNNTASVGSAGTVTNIVDASVSIASLNYLSDSNAGNFHTTQINNGQTLTVTGAMSLGITSGFVGTNVTIKGATAGQGTLTVNNPATNFTTTGTTGFYTPNFNTVLDMKDLGTFNATVNAFNVSTGFGPSVTTLNLAGSNTIVTNDLNIGTQPWNGFITMNLGQTNVIHTDRLGVASINPQSGSGTLQFRAGLVNPTLTIRDKAGTGRADVIAGARNQDSGVNPGTINLNGGIVDALLGTVRLGIGNSTAGAGSNQSKSAVGILQFNGGTIDATSITLAEANTGNVPLATGTLSIGSISSSVFGTLIADTITMTHRPTGTAGSTAATINLNGSAVLRATNIQQGASAGTGASTRTFN